MKQPVRLRLSYIISDYLTANVGWMIIDVVRYFSLPLAYKPTLDEFLLHDHNIVLGQILFPLMMLAMYAISSRSNRVLTICATRRSYH